ncbi:MAG: dihydropteroate synthase [Thermoleophilaceae bacterium]|nr:dihydropteroate synthase [Thermoleophilaceae bacterium]
MRLRLRDLVVELEPGRPLVMGIVNASPESFSDGASVGSLEQQVERALSLGADIVDVGGESGVTDRPPVPAEEEAARVVPLVERLAAEGVLVSVDTWKASVARAAVDAGAAMINDVSGLIEPGVADVCALSGAALVVMHTRARPKEKVFPGYDDVMADVLGFLRERIAVALERGVAEEQIVVDPGPDFAKTPAETVEALRRLPELRELGRPVLLAASRKDFVGALSGRAPADRLAGTLAAIGEGVTAGAAIVRVHDVAATRDFLTVRAALRGETEVPRELHLDQRLRRQAGSPA